MGHILSTGNADRWGKTQSDQHTHLQRAPRARQDGCMGELGERGSLQVCPGGHSRKSTPEPRRAGHRGASCAGKNVWSIGFMPSLARPRSVPAMLGYRAHCSVRKSAPHANVHLLVASLPRLLPQPTPAFHDYRSKRTAPLARSRCSAVGAPRDHLGTSNHSQQHWHEPLIDGPLPQHCFVLASP